LQNNDRFINVKDSPYLDSNIFCSYVDELQFYDKYKGDKRFSVMSLNVQSLPAKFNEFAEMLSHMSNNKCEPDVICLQETWRITDPELYKIAGYQCPVFKLRESMQGGGVTIYVKDCHHFKVIDKYSSSVDKVAETLFVEIISKDKNKLFFGSIYRTNAKYTSLSEKVQNEMFLDLISNILSNINETGAQAYIAGDFNIDVLKLNSSDFVDDYINSHHSQSHSHSQKMNGFLQIISKRTRCTRHTATLLDHVLTNDSRSSYESCIIVNKLSDHFPVVSFCTKNKVIKEQYVETRFINENSVLTFKLELSKLSWNDVIECQDTQLSFDMFLSNFLDLYNLFFPKKKVKLNRNIHKLEPWFTNELLISHRKKLYLGKCAARNPTKLNVNKYKLYRNIYNSVVRNSKKLYYETELEKHKNYLRVMWDILRRAIRKTKSKNSFISSIKVNGEELSDPKIFADRFNTFLLPLPLKFQTKFTPLLDHLSGLLTMGRICLFLTYPITLFLTLNF
jgi:exonuclease III